MSRELAVEVQRRRAVQGRSIADRLRATPVRKAIDLTETWATQLPPQFRRELLKLLDAAHDANRQNLLRVRVENDVEEGAFGG